MMRSCWCRSGGRGGRQRQRQGRAGGVLLARWADGAEVAGTSGEEEEAGGERAARRSEERYFRITVV